MRRASEQRDEGAAQDPLTALISGAKTALRAAVRAEIRAEIDALRAELATLTAKDPPTLPAHLTLAEAARELRCSSKTVRRLISTGRLASSRSTEGPGSSRVLVPRAGVEALLRAGGA